MAAKELALSPSEEKNASDLTYSSKSNEDHVPDPELLEAGDAPLGKVTGESHALLVMPKLEVWWDDSQDERLLHTPRSWLRLDLGWVPEQFVYGIQRDLCGFPGPSGWKEWLTRMQKILYPVYYTSSVSTRVSNALLVGGECYVCAGEGDAADQGVEVLGQVVVGLICDRIGRKVAIVGTTLMIVLGGILSTASSGPSASSSFPHLSVNQG